MTGFFTFLGKTAAFLFAVILTFALSISLLSYDVGRVIFNDIRVKQVVTDVSVESDLIPAALSWFSREQIKDRYETNDNQVGEDEPEIQQLLSYLHVDDWRKIRDEVLPDVILAEWVSVTVDGVYRWIETEEHVPQIVWDINVFKDRVNSEHGVSAILAAFESLPPCTDEQIADMIAKATAASPGEDTLSELCRFPDPWLNDQLQGYWESLNNVVADMPESFDLTAKLAETEDTGGPGPEAIKIQLRWMRLFMRIAPFVPVILLVAILLFGVRSIKSWGWWWGVPLTVGGLISVILSVSSREVITYLLASGPLSEVPPLIRTEALDAVQRLAQDVFRSMFRQSLVIFMIGLVLIVVGVTVREHREKAD